MIARRAGMWTFEFVVSAPCFSRSQSRTSSWSESSAAVYHFRLGEIGICERETCADEPKPKPCKGFYQSRKL